VLSAHTGPEAARKFYEKGSIPIGSTAERVRHVVQCAFNGQRIVIFSGGTAESDVTVLSESDAVHAGGGFGSISGRNSFQRKKPDALRLPGAIMDIYIGAGS
jgi:class I fructose-bisphosphate aldolase